MILNKNNILKIIGHQKQEASDHILFFHFQREDKIKKRFLLKNKIIQSGWYYYNGFKEVPCSYIDVINWYKTINKKVYVYDGNVYEYPFISVYCNGQIEPYKFDIGKYKNIDVYDVKCRLINKLNQSPGDFIEINEIINYIVKGLNCTNEN